MTNATSSAEAVLPEHHRSRDATRSAGQRLTAEADLPPITGTANGRGAKATVTIIGAGIAGLVAAYELERLGYPVEVLEGSRRLGGRIYSHRFGADAEAPVAELGAMRIPTKHSHTMGYIDRLGLADEVRPFKTLLSDENAFLGKPTGYVRLRDAPPVLLECLRHRLAHKGYREETMLFGAQLGLVVNAIAPPAQREGLRHDLSLQLLDAADRIDLRPHIEGGTAAHVDLHAVFAAYPHLQTACSGDLRSFLDDILTETSPELVRVRGGMSRIVERLSRRVRGPILRGREVVGLDVRADGVRIRIREGTRIVTRNSDYVVCTVPFPALRRMELKGFSKDKLDIIRDVQYVPATKVAFHCREPFWESEGIMGGASSSDGRIRQTYYPSVDGDPALGAVLLASYTIGDDADLIGRLPPAARYAYVLTELGEMHPALLRPGMVLNAMSVAWGRHRWTGGGCAVRWGKDEAAIDEERRRVTRPQHTLFFAGEHCSSSPAWIDGAIESAIDAVGQVVAQESRQRTARTRYGATVERRP
ncbi:flavin monoamine oxidase family protein [Pseudonocardia acidicola]|uniref:NAD(P)-binding protein n=1 Tax=Pseudonocardia acidicola TaxID=2724939 RepID=A0ABX1SHM1_9PSEU|nr:NAD(P)/FAD-dependent oxidoreductase [Pseudonocardia acidicola]NMH99978.1 NAD(P)-binding protein [Pseudonocardia acidicola]